jgi:hypothetical protein
MSPEAAAGRFAEVAATADVYGLGATLYHLVTGKPPFDGETTEAIVAKVISELPPRPRSVRPDVPPALEGVIVKAMEKDPAARYPTAAALAADLRRFLAGETLVAPLLSPSRRASRWLRRQRMPIATTIGIAVLATALIALGMALRPGPGDPERAIRDEIAAGKRARLLTAQGLPRAPTWPLDAAPLHPTGEFGGTCTFEAPETRVLLLLTDPGVASYRVDAEICQTRKLTTDPSNCDVGLVLAYAGQEGPSDTRVHSMMVLGFTEPSPTDRPKAKRELALRDVGGLTGPPWLQPRSFFATRGVPPVPLKPDESGEPQWRHVFAVVTRDGLRIPGRDEWQPVHRDTILEGRNELQGRLATGPSAPLAPLPDWSPRMPLGIWCRSSWVSIRNVTIEALH